MGWLQYIAKDKKTDTKQGTSLLRKEQCNVCPLNDARIESPKMQATGSEHPVIYIVGEAPGEHEDHQGKQFVGQSGKLLRDQIPKQHLDDIRWNNVIRCRPPKNRNPNYEEVECCRPFLERDIEATKPSVIIGFGNFPLDWFLGDGCGGITKWRGRRIPVKVGSHVCWYYPMLHPSAILRDRGDKLPGGFFSEYHYAFALDIRQAFKEAYEGLPKPVVHTEEMARANIECFDGSHINDLSILREILKEMKREEYVGYDYETSCLHPYDSDAVLLSVAIASKHECISIAIDHKDAKWSKRQKDELINMLKGFLAHPVRKVSHSLGFELEWTSVYFGNEYCHASFWEDSLSQAYLLDTRLDGHSLDFLCLQYFGLHLKKISNLDRSKLYSAPLDLLLTYNGIDAKYHRNLFEAQLPRIKEQNLEKVYDLQIARIVALTFATIQGVPIDQDRAKELHNEFADKLKQVEDELYQNSLCIQFQRVKGRIFVPSKLGDVSDVLDMIGVQHDNVDEAVLSRIQHPVAKLILDWRGIAKALSTYIDPVVLGSKECVVFPDGLIHPTYTATRVITWRTSGKDPNIQNWPKRQEDQKQVKSVVKPRAGKKVVSIDYSGIQARNVAMESKDRKLVKAFFDHYDIHTEWMNRLAKKEPSWLNNYSDKKAARHATKNRFVFPTFFGAYPKSISEALKVPYSVIDDLQQEFFGEFKDIDKWHKKLKEDYYSQGWVTGCSGFIHRAPISQNQLINAPIQADEACIVLDAMARLSEIEDGQRYQACIEVHDDLTFIWDADEIDRNLEVVIPEMLKIAFPWINVPLAVEVSIGDNWAEMKEIGQFESYNGGYREIGK